MAVDKSGSSFIEEVVNEELLKLDNDEQKQAFAKAIKMSIRLDRSGSEPPQPYSAFEIKDRTVFNVRIQKDKKIIIDKDTAIKFLKQFGYTVSSISSFKKKHNKPSYEQFFLRDSAVVGRRQLVCTYAEWLHMEGFLFEPAFPEVLVEYLPDPEWRPNFRNAKTIVDVNLLADNIDEAIQVGVKEAIRHLLEALECEQKQEFPPETNSFHQRFQYATREVISRVALEELFNQAKQSLERKFRGLGDENSELDPVSQELVTSLENVPNAVIKVGKIYIVKTTDGDNVNTDVAMQSSALKDAYERDPKDIRDPQRVRQLLQ